MIDGMDIISVLVKKSLAEYSGTRVDEIKDETQIDEFGIDSLNFIELLMSLEDEFDIEISDEDAEDFKTVSDIIEFVKERT